VLKNTDCEVTVQILLEYISGCSQKPGRGSGWTDAAAGPWRPGPCSLHLEHIKPMVPPPGVNRELVTSTWILGALAPSNITTASLLMSLSNTKRGTSVESTVKHQQEFSPVSWSFFINLNQKCVGAHICCSMQALPKQMKNNQIIIKEMKSSCWCCEGPSESIWILFEPNLRGHFAPSVLDF